MAELILGGVRSGKSREAERRAEESGLAVCVIATATAGDEEMAARIAAHRLRRPAGWRTVEEPLHLAVVLQREAANGMCLIVDCLTLWLTNWLVQGTSADGAWRHERSELLATLPHLSGRIVLVSNETNQGVIPPDPLSRRFCDEAGRLHQDLAGCCRRVTLMAAGLPMELK